MGLIIGSKIQALMTGYPTISDKYDACGGYLSGTANVKSGELVKKGTNAGEYEAIGDAGVAGVANVAGFVLATNVKVPAGYPAEANPETKPGEVFNLLLRGGIAVEVDDVTGLVEGGIVYMKKHSSTTALTKVLTAVSTNNTALVINGKEVRFTGVYEDHGTSTNHKYVAEVILG